jgi:hypothetical protein
VEINLLSIQEVKEIEKEVCLEMVRTTMYQNLPYKVKAILRQTFITINAYIQKEERS